jgi:two-component sensor histidine kinase
MGAASKGARLSELVAAQVEPHVADAQSRIALEGDECELTANAALHIGLALSELTIAAAGAGVLARSEGHVNITAERAVDPAIDPSRPSLRLTWVECGNRPSPLPEGFSRQLLERLVPSALSGHASLESTDEGLRFVLTVGPDEFH